LHAKRSAIACDDDALFVDVQLFRVALLANALGQREEAAEALRDAEMVLAKLDEPDESLRQYERWKAAGLLALAMRDYEGAREHYERALAVLAVLGPHPSREAKIHNNLGVLHQEQGHYELAAAAYERATNVIEQALSPTHPMIRARRAQSAINLGLAELSQGNLEEVEVHMRAVIEHGDPALVVKAYAARVQAHHRAKDVAAAADLGAELIAYVGEHDYLTPEIIAEALTTAGQALGDLGRSGGVEALDRALGIWIELGETTHADYCRFYLAQALQATGEGERSRALLFGLRRGTTYADDEDFRAAVTDLAASFDPI
jgi:tetratricopeptide (TPR) repeat protein